MKTRVLPGAVLALLGLLPRQAAGQGSIGPREQIQTFSGFGGSTVQVLLEAGDLAFFTVRGTYVPESLWRSDGTVQGTFALGETRGLSFWAVQGSRVFFTRPRAQEAGGLHRDLWRSDGTVEGTVALTRGLSLAVDARAGDPPTSLAVSEGGEAGEAGETGLVFFSAGAEAAQPDYELWATDGTPAGTRLVENVNLDGPSNPSLLAALGGRLFFLADTAQGPELWRSDGTPEGTERVESLHHLGGGAVALTRAGDSLFLVAETATDVELWRSDGTAPGTFLMIKVLSSRLAGYAAAGGRFFLATRNPGAQSTELWAADGDPASRAFPTRVLEAPAPDPLQLLADGDGVLFSLSETGSGLEPWRSDGTVEGTRRIADLCPGPCGSSPVFLGTYGARAVLEATDGVSGREPWLTDGTAAGTWRLGDLCPGECGSFVAGAREVGGWLVLKTSEQDFWMSDGSRDGAWVAASTSTPTAPWAFLPGRLLFPDQLYFLGSQGFLWSLPVTAPPSPPGDWLESARVPGFRFKVRIDGRIPGRQEPACPARTLCASGALPARPEVFLRVSPSTPEGRLWPAVVKLTTSDVEVWALQTATGHLRHYHLAATDPAGSTLEGLLDRDGFRALPGASGSAIEESGAPRPPSGPWLSDRSLKGFQVKARLTSGGKSRALRLEPCVAGTLCLSGAVRGQTELLVRVAGPKPNGYLWPLLARFTPARVEVWIQQNKTGTVRYYRLEAGSDLDGLVDRLGFKPSSRR